MKFLSIFLLISFITIGVFGYTLFQHGMSHEKINCVAFAFSDADCPLSAIGMAFHHISAFRSFSNSLTAGFTLLGLFLVLLLLSTLFLVISNTDLSKIKFSFSNYFSPPFINERKKKISWLSLLENSPSFTL